MYRIYLCITALAVMITFSGCKDEYHTGLYASEVKVELKISPSCLMFSSDNTEKSILIKTNATWEVMSTAEWIQVSPTAGKNIGTIIVSVSANKLEMEREGQVVVKINETNNTHIISVIQSAKSFENPVSVDMGLPSGTLWGTCNLGAKNTYEYGDYYSFGENKPKSDYSRESYPYLNQYNSPEFDYIIYGENNNLKLPRENDAAFLLLGNGWHIPTYQEFRELRNNCVHKWVDNFEDKNVSGYLFVALNGNKLFFPAAGCMEGFDSKHLGFEGFYRTSTMFSKNYLPYIVNFYWKEFNDGQTDGGYFGYSVRPVYTPHQ